jgi:hypothetical protein
MTDAFIGKAHPVCGDVADDFGGRISAFLRSRHPLKTAESVAAESGVPRETVASWLKGAARPSGSHFVRLVSAYGPELLAATMRSPPGWLVAAERAERRKALEARLAAVRCELKRATDDDARERRPEAARVEARGLGLGGGGGRRSRA